MIKKNTTPKSPGWSILYSTPTCRSDFPGPLWMKIRVLCPCTSFKATVSAVKGFGAVLKFASAKFRYSDDLVNWTAAENHGCGRAHSPKKEERWTNPFLQSVSYSASSRSIFVYFCNYHRWFLGGLWIRMAPINGPYINLFVCRMRGFILVCSDHWLPSSLANMKMGHESCQTWNISPHLLPASLVCQNAKKWWHMHPIVSEFIEC